MNLQIGFHSRRRPPYIFCWLGIFCLVAISLANAAPTPNNPLGTGGKSPKGIDHHSNALKKLQQQQQQQIDDSDEDVIELEQLKHSSEENEKNSEEILPALEKQLESEVNGDSMIDLGQPEEEQNGYENDRSLADQQQQQQDMKPPIKAFPGAARLTLGQHPEIDTSGSEITQEQEQEQHQQTNNGETDDISSSSTSSSSSSSSSSSENTNNGQRRSAPSLLSGLSSEGGPATKIENMKSLLKHSGGQYSAFDMAQYVFWTGDEIGVAHAIEELIQEGLMSRENAIKFLRDIRLGIEYLQNSYANHAFTNNNIKGKFDKMEIPLMTTTTTTLEPTTERKPPQQIKATLSPAVQKAIQKIPSLLKLNELASADRREDNAIDYDEVAGRLRLADFLYAEYSLEEVIYQLAKVMFSQSLTRGSEQAQTALQRLTGFLESEGSHGRISPALQKKVLDVLLAALSDTLAEHPELLNSARISLGGAMNQIPKHSGERKQ